MGLVNRVVEPEELMDATYDYARTLATEVSPASLAATKLQMYLDLHRDAATPVRDAADRLDGDDEGGRLRRGGGGPGRAAAAPLRRPAPGGRVAGAPRRRGPKARWALG